MRTWKAWIWVLCIAGWIGAGAAEEKNPAPKPPPEKTSDPAAKSAPAKGSRLTVYVPPSRGSVGARTGGGTRVPANVPRVAALVPDHVGLTTREKPTLAWFLSADTDAAVEVTLAADGARDAVTFAQAKGPLRAGIHLIDLGERAAQLVPGTTYDWYVSLIVDPAARERDVVAGGAIEREAASAELTRDLAAGGEPSYRVLARHGIWYDAIADLSRAIEASPPASAAGRELRAERAALLEQVGVGAVAQYDRNGSH